jgi:hypothetical protein
MDNSQKAEQKKVQGEALNPDRSPHIGTFWKIHFINPPEVLKAG